MSDLIRISVRGKARTSRRLTAAEREAEAAMKREIVQLTRRTRAIFAKHAPGRLGRRIRTLPDRRPGQIGRQLTVDARDPESGYNYLGVTRFGHRRKTIRPRDDRGRASVLATSGPRAPEAEFRGQAARRPALRIVLDDGRVIFRHSVRGYKPPSDWVSDARAEMQPLVAEAARRLGRRVVSRLG